jgi:hypothetical protein
MRVMVFVKASPDSEAGVMPSEEELAAMMKYNEELVKAGVMLAGDGLHPSSKGARVHFSGDSRTVVDGPFTETKELVAGYWLWQVSSMDEAIEWLRRCPNPHGNEGIVEILPNMTGYIFMNFIIAINNAIYAIVGMYMLGLLPSSAENWGLMIQEAWRNNAMLLPRATPYLLAPLIMIALFQIGLVTLLLRLAELMEEMPRALILSGVLDHEADEVAQADAADESSGHSSTPAGRGRACASGSGGENAETHPSVKVA